MDRSRYFLIGLGVLLMAALVVVVGLSLTAGERPARVLPVQAEPTPTLPSEAGMYARVDAAAEYAAMPKEPNRKRTRAVYYARRAYPGAPPVIPHAIDEGDAGGRLCLACHGDGGWETVAPPPLRGAAMLGSPPPIPHALQLRENCRACHAGPGAVDEFRTSHPERVTCRQCHALAAPPAEAFARPAEAGR